MLLKTGGTSVRFLEGLEPLALPDAASDDFLYGNPEDNGVEVDGDALAAFGLVGINLGPFGIFGKAGAANWDGKVSGSNISGDDDGTDPVYGVGARFALGSFQIRAEYEYFDIDVVDGIDFISASLLYTF